ncbi:MAG: hypothetical protein ACTS7D_00615 [Candidatus Hodgkinia cicadicola]
MFSQWKRDKAFWSDSFPGNLFTQTWLNATTIESTPIWLLTNRKWWVLIYIESFLSRGCEGRSWINVTLITIARNRWWEWRR